MPSSFSTRITKIRPANDTDRLLVRLSTCVMMWWDGGMVEFVLTVRFAPVSTTHRAAARGKERPGWCAAETQHAFCWRCWRNAVWPRYDASSTSHAAASDDANSSSRHASHGHDGSGHAAWHDAGNDADGHANAATAPNGHDAAAASTSWPRNVAPSSSNGYAARTWVSGAVACLSACLLACLVCAGGELT